ncbi:MAG: hypothetical protein ACK5VE_03820 [Alphaproteobacteria bacterium]|jgi:hypothetical protein
MAFQFSTAARNAALDAIETAVGATAILRIRSGGVPANCATPDSGTLLAEMTLPSNWLADAASGSKGILGTWQDLAANAGGTAGHFRVYDNTGATCHIQGTVTVTGGGGDMTLDNTSIAANQQVTVTAFTLTAGGA